MGLQILDAGTGLLIWRQAPDQSLATLCAKGLQRLVAKNCKRLFHCNAYGVRTALTLIHVVGLNLGVLLRALMGCGTERAEAARDAFLLVIRTDSPTAIVVIADHARRRRSGTRLIKLPFATALLWSR